MTERRRFNPLVLNPDDYEKLFDEDFLEDADQFSDRDQYEDMSSGARRKKPALDDM